MQLKGKVKKVFPVTQISDKFKKQEIVLETPEPFPQNILIQFVNDKVELLKQVSEGTTVTIDINIRGREWVNPQNEVKYFNSIEGWRVGFEGFNNKAEKLDNIEVSPDDDLPF